MHVAVVGCGHGEVDKIYEVIESIEQRRGIKISLLLCCGDFQSVRNMTDLRCMACPIKYQQMHDFHRYYSGEKKAPVTTIFIGGNHEASNFLQELPYGGWVAPNIFYIGYAGVFRFGNVRIAGVSGIFKGQDYLKGRYEVPPYDQGTMRSVYHYRNLDLFRLKQLKQPLDIVLSHDWPKGIHNFGDFEQLLRRKPFFREEIERNELGSRPLMELLEKVRPSYWFSAHMHVKFAAFVPSTYSTGQTSGLGSSEHESTIEDECTSSVNESPSVSDGTKFLALDKVLPRRQFLQIIEVPSQDPVSSDVKLEYDLEWLAILKATNHLVSAKPKPCFMPGPGGQSRHDFTPTEDELTEVRTVFGENLQISENSFSKTGPVHQPGEQPQKAFALANSQTKEFCDKLGISDPLCLADPGAFTNPLLMESSGNSSFDGTFHEYNSQMNVTINQPSEIEDSLNPDEISLDLDEEGDGEKANSTRERAEHESTPICRPKLNLPPPKSATNTMEEDDSLPQVSSDELELLKSVMGDTEDSSSAGFFIDTQGSNSTENKRRRVD